MKIVVSLSQNAFLKMKYLTKNTDEEVQAFLIGKGLRVEDVYVLDQEVTSASTDVENNIISDFMTKCIKEGNEDLIAKVIGTFHSHNSMGCFWSTTDTDNMETLGNTINCVISIVTSKESDVLEMLCRVDLFKPFRTTIDKVPFEIDLPDMDKITGRRIEEVEKGDEGEITVKLDDGSSFKISKIKIEDEKIDEECKKLIGEKCKSPKSRFDDDFTSFEEMFKSLLSTHFLEIEEGILIKRKFVNKQIKKICKKWWNKSKDSYECGDFSRSESVESKEEWNHDKEEDEELEEIYKGGKYGM